MYWLIVEDEVSCILALEPALKHQNVNESIRFSDPNYLLTWKKVSFKCKFSDAANDCHVICKAVVK